MVKTTVPKNFEILSSDVISNIQQYRNYLDNLKNISHCQYNFQPVLESTISRLNATVDLSQKKKNIIQVMRRVRVMRVMVMTIVRVTKKRLN